MLLEFQCSNHKSIKELVTFSMLAGTDDMYEESLIHFDKFRVSRSSVIYGANGSGKSNVLSALAFMAQMVRKSVEFQKDRPFPQYPHRLSAPGTPSEYSANFVYKGIRYSYGFSVQENLQSRKTFINDEYLYYFPNKKKVVIFERDGMVINPGDKYKNSFQTSIKEILKPNRLFLSCAANYSNVNEVAVASDFFTHGLMVFSNMTYFDEPESVGLEIAANALKKSVKLKKDFIALFQKFGTDVKDIKIRQRKRPKPKYLLLDENMSEEMYRYFTRPITEIKLVYDQFEIDLDKEESRGMRRFFQIAAPILFALNLGQVLVCDELESSLHERILFEIVRQFKESKRERPGQLIFSTHNTNLLNSDLFRRDQVWFTELNKERATALYSLIELKNVRKYENLAKGYISGRYGAIPLLNENIVAENKY